MLERLSVDYGKKSKISFTASRFERLTEAEPFYVCIYLCIYFFFFKCKSMNGASLQGLVLPTGGNSSRRAIQHSVAWNNLLSFIHFVRLVRQLCSSCSTICSDS